MGTQSNTSGANAVATNTNTASQSAHQTQQAGGVDSTHVGGSGQSQVVNQSAPTNQTATAAATASTEQGSSSASGVQTSSSEVAQTVEQSQSGGGTQAQVVVQSTDDGDSGLAYTGAVGRLEGDRADGWLLATAATTFFTPRSVPRAASESSAGRNGSRRAPVRHRLRTGDAASAASLAGAGHARRGGGRDRRRLAVGFQRTLDSVPLDGPVVGTSSSARRSSGD